MQRLFEGDEILSSWIGTEQQVMLRLFLVCKSKQELACAIQEYQEEIKAFNAQGENMLVAGFDAAAALEV